MNIQVAPAISITEIFETDGSSYLKDLNATNVGEWMGSMPYPYCESHLDWWFKELKKQKEQYGRSINFAIRKNDELIGGIGIYDYNPSYLNAQNSNHDLEITVGINANTNYHWASLGYWLADRFSGNGIMSDVVSKFVPNVMQTFSLIRLEATVWHPNIASQKVLEKNGFIIEGRCRKFYYKNGEYYDRLIFAKVL